MVAFWPGLTPLGSFAKVDVEGCESLLPLYISAALRFRAGEALGEPRPLTPPLLGRIPSPALWFSSAVPASSGTICAREISDLILDAVSCVGRGSRAGVGG